MVLPLLISCGSMQEKADELRNIAMACNEHEKVPVIENGIAKIEDGKVVMQRPEGTCGAEWDAWNEVEERIVNAEIRKAESKRPKCPKEMVAYCDKWCMRDKPKNRKWECVRRVFIQIY